MIDPCTQYILHQERQQELMAQIERKLAAQERANAKKTGVAGETGDTGAGNHPQPWYSVAQQWLNQKWLKEKVLHRGLSAKRSIAAEQSRQAISLFTKP